MDALDPTRISDYDDHRGNRHHRFMESSDLNAGFQALFMLLHVEIGRDAAAEGVYGIEMDACIPGEVLGTARIDIALDAEAASIRQLYHAYRPEALFARVERRRVARRTVLHVDLVSEDAHCVADYPLRRGRRSEELMAAEHRRA
jgi:hypothetical protein